MDLIRDVADWVATGWGDRLGIFFPIVLVGLRRALSALAGRWLPARQPGRDRGQGIEPAGGGAALRRHGASARRALLRGRSAPVPHRRALLHEVRARPVAGLHELRRNPVGA